MADEPNVNDAVEEKAPKKKFPMKTVLILAVIMLLEGGTVAALFVLSGPPDEGRTEDRSGPVPEDLGEREVEELVVEDRFANSKRGDVYLYDTHIYISVKKKHVEDMKTIRKEKSATIQSEIGTVFRGAEPSYMHEVKLLTLKRQIKHVLDGVFGEDAEGDSVVKKVLITRCVEYRADF